MTDNNSIREQQQELHHEAAILAEQMKESADQIEHLGIAPDETLLKRVKEFHVTMREFSSKMESHRKETQAVIDRIFGNVLSLHAFNGNTQLDDLKTQAVELQQSLDVNNLFEDDRVESLRSGTHPWCAVLRLVSNSDELSDDEWKQLTEQVSNEIGSDFATAIQRGKIVLQENQYPTSTAPEKVATETSSLLASNDSANESGVDRNGSNEAIDTDETPSEDSGDTIFDEELLTNDVLNKGTRSLVGDEDHEIIKNHTQSESALFDEQRAKNDEPKDEQVAWEQSFLDPDPAICSAAEKALHSDRFERGEQISRLTKLLLFEGRAGLAAHLTKAAEEEDYPFTKLFPSSLIQAWTLGHEVVFPRGQISGLLTDAFSNSHAPQDDDDANWKLAQSLFHRATALRPALVAPATGAAAIIRSYPMSDETVQLYNYCTRIGAYGDQIEGLNPALFQQHQGHDEQKYNELHNDILEWQRHQETITVRYEMAKPLFLHANWSVQSGSALRYPSEVFEWQKWQKAITTTNRLIHPVLENDRGAVTEVRAEIERVSENMMSSTSSKSHGENNSSEEVRTYVREALTFAQRWIAISQPKQETPFHSEEIEELRQEIESRHDAVVAEINALAKSHPSFDVEVASGCLLQAMDQVRQLFSGDGDVPHNETDPRHILNGDLLRVKDVPLNTRWLPEIAHDAIESRILKSLTQPLPDWKTAFEENLEQGNIETAERIMGMGIFSTSERTQLQTRLSAHVSNRRNELWARLDETEDLIQSAVQDNTFSEQDYAGFSSKMNGIRQRLKTRHEFRTEAKEISELKEIISRRYQLDSNPPQQETSSDWIMDFSDTES